VIDATTGAPVADAVVSAWRPGNDTPSAETRSRDDGGFRMRPSTGGPHRLLVAKAGYAHQLLEVDLQIGVNPAVVFELRPSDGLGLTVVDARDHAPLNATAAVLDAAGRIVARARPTFAGDGVLTIPLAAGQYRLVTSDIGYGSAMQPVTAPGRVRVALTPGGTLVVESARELSGRLRLVRPGGEEYVRSWSEGISRIELAGQRTQVPNLPAGAYTGELVDTGGLATGVRMPVTIREGQVTTLHIE
jgi:hypothetical protein